MREIKENLAAAATPTPRDMALFLLGASMLTSSVRKSETAAIDQARRRVLNHAHQWRSRAGTLSSSLEAMLGTALVAYTVWHVLRREIAVAEVALGLDGGASSDEPAHGSVPNQLQE